MQRITQILISPTEPLSTNLLWAKLIGDKLAFYLHLNGRWRPISIVNDHDTPNTDDDTIAAIGDIGQTIKEEVTRQVTEHDQNVQDVHYADSTVSGEDYPEVTIFGSGI